MRCSVLLADRPEVDAADLMPIRDDLRGRMRTLVHRLALSARHSWLDPSRATQERDWGTAAARALGRMHARLGEIDQTTRALDQAARPRAELIALLEAQRAALLRDSVSWREVLATAGA